jgi:hypothetical protein
MIPMDPKLRSKEHAYLKRLQQMFNVALKHKLAVSVIFFIFTAVMTAAAPNPFNIALTVIYTITLLKMIWLAVQRPLITGVITGPNHKPLANVILKFVNSENGLLEVVSQTDSKGRYKAFVHRGKYQLLVIKPGYIWQKGAKLSFEELHIQKAKHLPLLLHPVEQVAQQIFGTPTPTPEQETAAPSQPTPPAPEDTIRPTKIEL